MGASNLERLRESVVSFLSMMSIAGITVARFGVECEKNSVTSLSICANRHLSPKCVRTRNYN